MSSKFILFIGLIFSIIYVSVVVYLQTYDDTVHIDSKGSVKFLYVQKGNKVDIVSKLSSNDKNSSLISYINDICLSKKCDIHFDFENDIIDKDFSCFLESLLFFIRDNNLTKASIIADDKKVDINFLLKDKNSLETLKKLYIPYIKTYQIVDQSSVVKIFDIKDIEKSINDSLKDKEIVIDSDFVNFKTRKIFNQIFKKLEALDGLSIELYLDIDSEKIDILKRFILANYPWIKDITIKKDEKNSIKIKEVLA